MVALDISGPLRLASDGSRYVVVASHKFSKFVTLPVIPRMSLMHQGKQFPSTEWKNIAEGVQVILPTIITQKSQSNQVERVLRERPDSRKLHENSANTRANGKNRRSPSK